MSELNEQNSYIPKYLVQQARFVLGQAGQIVFWATLKGLFFGGIAGLAVGTSSGIPFAGWIFAAIGAITVALSFRSEAQARVAMMRLMAQWSMATMHIEGNTKAIKQASAPRPSFPRPFPTQE